MESPNKKRREEKEQNIKKTSIITKHSTMNSEISTQSQLKTDSFIKIDDQKDRIDGEDQKIIKDQIQKQHDEANFYKERYTQKLSAIRELEKQLKERQTQQNLQDSEDLKSQEKKKSNHKKTETPYKLRFQKIPSDVSEQKNFKSQVQSDIKQNHVREISETFQQIKELHRQQYKSAQFQSEELFNNNLVNNDDNNDNDSQQQRYVKQEKMKGRQNLSTNSPDKFQNRGIQHSKTQMVENNQKSPMSERFSANQLRLINVIQSYSNYNLTNEQQNAKIQELQLKQKKLQHYLQKRNKQFEEQREQLNLMIKNLKNNLFDLLEQQEAQNLDNSLAFDFVQMLAEKDCYIEKSQDPNNPNQYNVFLDNKQAFQINICEEQRLTENQNYHGSSFNQLQFHENYQFNTLESPSSQHSLKFYRGSNTSAFRFSNNNLDKNNNNNNQENKYKLTIQSIEESKNETLQSAQKNEENQLIFDQKWEQEINQDSHSKCQQQQSAFQDCDTVLSEQISNNNSSILFNSQKKKENVNVNNNMTSTSESEINENLKQKFQEYQNKKKNVKQLKEIEERNLDENGKPRNCYSQCIIF